MTNPEFIARATRQLSFDRNAKLVKYLAAGVLSLSIIGYYLAKYANERNKSIFKLQSDCEKLSEMNRELTATNTKMEEEKRDREAENEKLRLQIKTLSSQHASKNYS